MTGDLARFEPAMARQQLPIRVTRATHERFAKVNVRPNLVFIVLGRLDFDTKLRAAYADEQLSDLDPTGPNTQDPYFWCLSAEGVLIISRPALAPV